MAKILYIDDEPGVRSILSELLRTDGHEVMEAAEGGEGLRMLAGQGVDLVITDVVMPGKEGFEVITEIKAKHAGVRILAVSGGGSNSNLSYLTIAEKLGADRSLSKPFEIPEFLALVRQMASGGSK